MRPLALLRRSPLVAYFVLSYTWTWLCWWAAFAASPGRLSPLLSAGTLAMLGQFGPFVAASAVSWMMGGRRAIRELLGRMVRWRGGPTWLAVALLLIPATMAAAIWLYAYLIGMTGSLRLRDSWWTLPAHFIYTLLLCGPLGEEPGWRGFALPRLQDRYGPVTASVVLGLLGAGWHLPLWWLYPPPCSFPLFVAGAVLLTILFTWLFNHTGEGALSALIFHASMNTASVRLPGVPAYHVWVTCLAAVVAAILLLDRRLGLARAETDRRAPAVLDRQGPREIPQAPSVNSIVVVHQGIRRRQKYDGPGTLRPGLPPRLPQDEPPVRPQRGGSEPPGRLGRPARRLGDADQLHEGVGRGDAGQEQLDVSPDRRQPAARGGRAVW